MSRLLPALLLLPCVLLGQDRPDPWSRLRAMDGDGDGKVSRDEFTGPARLWERLDADGDGFVTEDEAASMRRGRRGGEGPRGAPAGGGSFDGNGDGKVSEAEWAAAFAKADENGDGLLDREELAAALAGRDYQDTAPQPGSAAPPAKARELATGREVDLTRPARTTVLVFGSWT